MQLSIIIVNYNVKYFLEQCLCSVMQAMQGLQAEVFVVDNASQDGSIEYLSHKFNSVIFIPSSQNLGFAKANNLALGKAKGKYILYLNPDTIIGENTLRDCIQFLDEHKEAGALGVQMLDGSGNFLPESKRSFPAVGVAFWKLCGMASLFPRSSLFNRYALGHLDKDAVHEVDVLAGAFMMVRKTVADSIHGFDEDYFMYGEDIDMSKRIKDNGFKNYYHGHIKIIHFKGESLSKASIKHIGRFYNAMIVFVGKHYKGINSSILKLLLKAAIVIRAAVSLAAAPFIQLADMFSKKSSSKNKMIFAGNKLNCETAVQIISSNLNHVLAEDMTAVSKQASTGDEIIFCTGMLSYADTIDFVYHHSKKYFYKWHGMNTGSIAGSASKNKTGEVYTGSFPLM